MQLAVDGEAVDLPRTMTYKGMMLSGVPNFAFTVGYTNASWTLKADLTSEYVCRLLAHMDAHGHRQCVPEISDPSIDRAAAARLHLRLRAALAPPVPETGLEGAMAAAPELRLRPADDPARRDRRRHDAVLQPGAAGPAGGVGRRLGEPSVAAGALRASPAGVVLLHHAEPLCKGQAFQRAGETAEAVPVAGADDEEVLVAGALALGG